MSHAARAGATRRGQAGRTVPAGGAPVTRPPPRASPVTAPGCSPSPAPTRPALVVGGGAVAARRAAALTRARTRSSSSHRRCATTSSTCSPSASSPGRTAGRRSRTCARPGSSTRRPATPGSTPGCARSPRAPGCPWPDRAGSSARPAAEPLARGLTAPAHGEHPRDVGEPERPRPAVDALGALRRDLVGLVPDGDRIGVLLRDRVELGPRRPVQVVGRPRWRRRTAPRCCATTGSSSSP